MYTGDLLVKKAREGVRVCMLVWDDKSSLNSSIMGGSGMMATHDEDTRKFFANTGVPFTSLLLSEDTSLHAHTLTLSTTLMIQDQHVLVVLLADMVRCCHCHACCSCPIC